MTALPDPSATGKPGEPPKPCAGCKGAKPLYFAEEEFWKYDAGMDQYRIVNLYGEFYPLSNHPAVSEQQLVEYYGNKLEVTTEGKLMWRSIVLIMDVLTANNLL